MKNLKNKLHKSGIQQPYTKYFDLHFHYTQGVIKSDRKTNKKYNQAYFPKLFNRHLKF